MGLAIGLLGALAAGRVLVSLLYGVGAADMIALATAMAVLALIALIACLLPRGELRVSIRWWRCVRSRR